MTLSELREQGAYWAGMSGPIVGSGSMGHDWQNGQKRPGFGPKK